MKSLILGAQKLGIAISEEQAQSFELYYRELVEWNKKMNLTAITDLREVEIKHFLDSLTVALTLPQPPPTPFRIIDVGSGAGLPGVPLKILMPTIEVVLLDSITKKTNFLRHLVDTLRLEGIKIVTGRAEEAARKPQYREAFDAAVSRALALLPTLVELTLPFCKLGGILIAQKKAHIDEEIAKASEAISILGGRLRETRPILLEGLAEERALIIIEKVAPTPESYPRRPGVPARRPL